LKINQIDIKEFNAFINAIDFKKISENDLIEYYQNSCATEACSIGFMDRDKATRNEFLKDKYIKEMKRRKYSYQNEFLASDDGEYNGAGSYSAEIYASYTDI
jgi:hypothetical protein